MSSVFAERLLAWYDRHGRTELPWKQSRSAYGVWISEIMLQQTQVATVIPYYLRFMARFPDVATLADAELDEVLHLWSGLGYYARARNLHAAACRVRDRHHGTMPGTLAGLLQLPGIGRSTAGAILALAGGQRQPILDGNVKRVLSRYHAVDGWPGKADVLRQLWGLSEGYTPSQRVADYTQAIMDLGATVCTRRRPRCGACPLQKDCVARRQGSQDRYPVAKARRSLPIRQVTFILLREPGGAVLLERRPPTGVWGSLWSLPECAPEISVADWCQERLGRSPPEIRELPRMRHTFTHFHLDITPAVATLEAAGVGVLDGDQTLWYNPRQPGELGLPAPVARLIARLNDEPQETRP